MKLRDIICDKVGKAVSKCPECKNDDDYGYGRRQSYCDAREFMIRKWAVEKVRLFADDTKKALSDEE